MKVDKATLYRERGKYASICVQVNLNNSLLDMFSIKGKHYKMEYDGLHMLCLECGRYGHEIARCVDKL